MFNQFILGCVQGIAEWLPVSSEGLIVLVQTNILKSELSFEELVQTALFLHLGTFLAAFVYFFKDVKILLSSLVTYKSASKDNKKLLNFLILSTIISGGLGIIFIKAVSGIFEEFQSSSQIINLLVGCLLLITAYLELRAKKSGHRTVRDINLNDSIILGVTQGFAALPGLSRSGLTVSTLLLRQFDKADSLKISFLMSLPIVLAGNIILNLEYFTSAKDMFIGLFCSFIFGLLTIHLLLKIAQKINFGYFVLFFGLLMILSVFI